MGRISEKILGMFFACGLLFLGAHVLHSMLSEYVFEVEQSDNAFRKVINLPVLLLYYHPFVFLVVAVALFIILFKTTELRTLFKSYRIKRGVEIETLKKSVKTQNTKGDYPVINFGGLPIHFDRPISYIGVPGSGKTLQIQILLGQILEDMKTRDDTRLLIREYKRGDFLPIVAASGIPYKRIDPSVKGSYSWDIAKDADNDAIITDIAFTLFPREEREHEFFSNSARTITAETIKGLRALVQEEWDFWDLFHVITSEERLLQVTKHAPMGGEPIKAIMEKAASSGDSFATIIVRVALFYQSIAAAWKNAPKVSLKEMAKSKEILFLGHSTLIEEQMNVISSAITERFIKYSLRKADSSTRKTYFILDELSNMSKIQSLGKLLKTGRSKGALSVCGFQDMGSLEITYGEKEAHSLLGMFTNMSIMECVPDTAKYISDYLGEIEIERDQFSTQTALNGRPSMTHSTQIVDRKKLPAHELQFGIPKTSKETGITSYYQAYYENKKKFWLYNTPWKEVLKNLPASNKEMEKLCQADEDDDIPSITPFLEEDYHRLKIKPPEKKEVKTPPSENEQKSRFAGEKEQKQALKDDIERIMEHYQEADKLKKQVPEHTEKQLIKLWEKLYPGQGVPKDIKTTIIRLSGAHEALKVNQTRRTSYRPPRG